MKDWSLLARAGGLDIPAVDVSKAATTLDALDAAFRPLAGGLTPEMEPCAVFRAGEENE